MFSSQYYEKSSMINWGREGNGCWERDFREERPDLHCKPMKDSKDCK